MTLQQILTALLTTGLAGTLAWWLIRNVPQLTALGEVAKAFAAFVLAGALCVLAYVASVFMAYIPAPADPRQWVEAVVPLLAWAYTISQASYWGERARRSPTGTA